MGCVALAIVLAAFISGAEGVLYECTSNMLHFSTYPETELTSLGVPNRIQTCHFELGGMQQHE